jgi:hypothetical protein
MGFTEVTKLDFKRNKRTGRMEPNVSAEERHKMMQALDLHEKEV